MASECIFQNFTGPFSGPEIHLIGLHLKGHWKTSASSHPRFVLFCFVLFFCFCFVVVVVVVVFFFQKVEIFVYTYM